MASRCGFPAPPLAQGQSKVSHKLQLSQQEEIKHRLTLFTFFIACFTGLFLLVSPVSSPEGFPVPSNESRSSGVPALDKLAENVLPASWAYYSPYRPAGKFEGSTREGCVISQVNIVSSAPLPCTIDLTADHSDVASGTWQIQRHGARYPTSGVTEAIVEALEKLQDAATYNDPKLDFMKDYAYDLGMNDLVKYGADQYVVGLWVSPFLGPSPCSLGQVLRFGRGNLQALSEFTR